jgi:hypothetical protein
MPVHNLCDDSIIFLLFAVTIVSIMHAEVEHKNI